MIGSDVSTIIAYQKKWQHILRGTEARPGELTPAERTEIPAASRYAATKDRAREIQDFDDRSEAAFAGVCKAVQDDPLIYASAELDRLRQAPQHDPVAAYNFVFANLRPTHVDAQMTAEARINSFLMLKGETVPAAYQRLSSYVNCLEIQNRPDDSTLKRHMKRAIKNNATASTVYMTKVETMMEREPPITFPEFCQGLLRKHDEQMAETEQEAALLTERKQTSSHHDNENEYANFSYNKGGKGNGGRGRGRGKSMGKGQSDARIGALSYGKGGYADESYYDQGGFSKQPFYSGGFRHNGGRGYNFGGRGKGRQEQSNQYKRPHSPSSSSGKGHSQPTQPKFNGYCNKCNHWGHKEIHCHAKKPRT